MSEKTEAPIQTGAWAGYLASEVCAAAKDWSDGTYRVHGDRLQVFQLGGGWAWSSCQGPRYLVEHYGLRPAASVVQPAPPPAETPGLRPIVALFAEAMEAALRRNDHKPGWRNDKPEALLRRLREETSELADAMKQGTDGNDCVTSEAVDVANFAMMIADLSGRLGEGQHRAPSAAPPEPAPSVAGRLTDEEIAHNVALFSTGVFTGRLLREVQEARRELAEQRTRWNAHIAKARIVGANVRLFWPTDDGGETGIDYPLDGAVAHAPVTVCDGECGSSLGAGCAAADRARERDTARKDAEAARAETVAMRAAIMSAFIDDADLATFAIRASRRVCELLDERDALRRGGR